MSALDAAARIPAVYLSNEDLGEDKVVKWWFYLLASGREELWPLTRYYSRERTPPADVVTGSVLVVRELSSLLPSLTATGHWSVVAKVTDITGAPTATILRRN